MISQRLFILTAFLSMKQLVLFICLFTSISAFSQSAGDSFFSEWTVHEIRFHFSQPGYWDSLKVNYTQDVYMRCAVTIDGVSFPITGVKFKGNSSYNNPSSKKPFRIDFTEYVDSQEYDGLKKLVLNNAFKDPTLLREKLELDFLNAHNIAAPRAAFTKLYINDHYWGLYSAVEDVSKTFLKDRFDNKSGNLFKGDPKGTLMWKGSAQQNLYETDYELKTNETENDWSDLIHFINILNNTPSVQLRDSLERYMNLSSWFSYWATQNLFVNLDSYIGSGHNYFIYHNQDTDKFEWITWDVNEAFGNFQMGITLTNIKVLPYTYIPQPANSRPMMNRVLADQNLKQQYADRLCTLLADFSNQKMDSRIDSLANLIRPYVYADTLKSYSNAVFEQNLSQDVFVPNVPGSNGLAGLKPFIAARRTSLLQQLAAVGCTTTSDSEAQIVQDVHIYPNPAADQVMIEAQGAFIRGIRVVNSKGVLVFTQISDNEQIMSIDLSIFPSGLYYIWVSTDQAILAQKLVIMR